MRQLEERFSIIFKKSFNKKFKATQKNNKSKELSLAAFKSNPLKFF
jgi:hypothetical protein